MASRSSAPADPVDPPGPPLGGSRRQAMHRLQVGLGMLLGIVLVVGLVSVVEQRAKLSDATAVPEAAGSVAPSAAPAVNDPLADAGVVPDLPPESASVAASAPAASGTAQRPVGSPPAQ